MVYLNKRYCALLIECKVYIAIHLMILTSVASSAAVKSSYDKMNALLDRGGIITRCVTKDDNVNMGTTLPVSI